MVQVTCANITRVNNGNGPVRFRFADGTELEFANMRALEEAIAQMDSDPEYAKMLMVAWWRARTTTNENLAEGKTLTWDLTHASPLRVQ